MENKIEEQDASNIVNLYQQILQETNSEPVALVILQELGKTRRAAMINKAESIVPPQERADDAATTAKQIAYLKSLGVKPKQGLSKQEASALIDHHNSITGAA